METRNRFRLFDSEDSIPPAYGAWRAGTTNRAVVLARQAGNRFLASLKDLQIRAQCTVYMHTLAHDILLQQVRRKCRLLFQPHTSEFSLHNTGTVLAVLSQVKSRVYNYPGSSPPG